MVFPKWSYIAGGIEWMPKCLKIFCEMGQICKVFVLKILKSFCSKSLRSVKGWLFLKTSKMFENLIFTLMGLEAIGLN